MNGGSIEALIPQDPASVLNFIARYFYNVTRTMMARYGEDEAEAGLARNFAIELIEAMDMAAKETFLNKEETMERVETKASGQPSANPSPQLFLRTTARFPLRPSHNVTDSAIESPNGDRLPVGSERSGPPSPRNADVASRALPEVGGRAGSEKSISGLRLLAPPPLQHPSNSKIPLNRSRVVDAVSLTLSEPRVEIESHSTICNCAPVENRRQEVILGTSRSPVLHDQPHHTGSPVMPSPRAVTPEEPHAPLRRSRPVEEIVNQTRSDNIRTTNASEQQAALRSTLPNLSDRILPVTRQRLAPTASSPKRGDKTELSRPDVVVHPQSRPVTPSVRRSYFETYPNHSHAETLTASFEITPAAPRVDPPSRSVTPRGPELQSDSQPVTPAVVPRECSHRGLNRIESDEVYSFPPKLQSSRSVRRIHHGENRHLRSTPKRAVAHRKRGRTNLTWESPLRAESLASLVQAANSRTHGSSVVAHTPGANVISTKPFVQPDVQDRVMQLLDRLRFEVAAAKSDDRSDSAVPLSSRSLPVQYRSDGDWDSAKHEVNVSTRNAGQVRADDVPSPRAFDCRAPSHEHRKSDELLAEVSYAAPQQLDALVEERVEFRPELNSHTASGPELCSPDLAEEVLEYVHLERVDDENGYCPGLDEDRAPEHAFERGEHITYSENLIARCQAFLDEKREDCEREVVRQALNCIILRSENVESHVRVPSPSVSGSCRAVRASSPPEMPQPTTSEDKFVRCQNFIDGVREDVTRRTVRCAPVQQIAHPQNRLAPPPLSRIGRTVEVPSHLGLAQNPLNPEDLIVRCQVFLDAERGDSDREVTQHALSCASVHRDDTASAAPLPTNPSSPPISPPRSARDTQPEDLTVRCQACLNAERGDYDKKVVGQALSAPSIQPLEGATVSVLSPRLHDSGETIRAQSPPQLVSASSPEDLVVRCQAFLDAERGDCERETVRQALKVMSPMRPHEIDGNAGVSRVVQCDKSLPSLNSSQKCEKGPVMAPGRPTEPSRQDTNVASQRKANLHTQKIVKNLKAASLEELEIVLRSLFPSCADEPAQVKPERKSVNRPPDKGRNRCVHLDPRNATRRNKRWLEVPTAVQDVETSQHDEVALSQRSEVTAPLVAKGVAKTKSSETGRIAQEIGPEKVGSNADARPESRREKEIDPAIRGHFTEGGPRKECCRGELRSPECKSPTCLWTKGWIVNGETRQPWIVYGCSLDGDRPVDEGVTARWLERSLSHRCSNKLMKELHVPKVTNHTRPVDVKTMKVGHTSFIEPSDRPPSRVDAVAAVHSDSPITTNTTETKYPFGDGNVYWVLADGQIINLTQRYRCKMWMFLSKYRTLEDEGHSSNLPQVDIRWDFLEGHHYLVNERGQAVEMSLSDCSFLKTTLNVPECGDLGVSYRVVRYSHPEMIPEIDESAKIQRAAEPRLKDCVDHCVGLDSAPPSAAMAYVDAEDTLSSTGAIQPDIGAPLTARNPLHERDTNDSSAGHQQLSSEIVQHLASLHPVAAVPGQIPTLIDAAPTNSILSGGIRNLPTESPPRPYTDPQGPCKRSWMSSPGAEVNQELSGNKRRRRGSSADRQTPILPPVSTSAALVSARVTSGSQMCSNVAKPDCVNALSSGPSELRIVLPSESTIHLQCEESSIELGVPASDTTTSLHIRLPVGVTLKATIGVLTTTVTCSADAKWAISLSQF